MANSTIPQLQETTEPENAFVLPVDSGAQTYKLKLENLLTYIHENFPDASNIMKGLVTTGNQTFAGDKTFNGALNIAGANTLQNRQNISSGSITLDVAGKSYFTMGSQSTTIQNISGGVTGQIITLAMLSGGSDLTLVHNNATTGTNAIFLSGGTKRIRHYNVLRFIFDNNIWFQLQPEGSYNGVYTPSFSNLTNLDYVTASPLGYTVRNDFVSIWGTMSIRLTANGTFTFRMSYPPGLAARSTNTPTPGSSIIAHGFGVTRRSYGTMRMAGEATTNTIWVDGTGIDTGSQEYFCININYLF